MSRLVSDNAAPYGGGAFQAIVPGTSQTVAYTGTAAQSSAFQLTTTLIRVIASTDCYLRFGSNPTATTSDMLLLANIPEYFGVTPGEKVSAIRSTASGTLYITEGA